jgi:hypothetical protein
VSAVIGNALARLWPDMGTLQYAETVCDGRQFIAVPAIFTTAIEYKLSRIILLDGPEAQGGTYGDDLKGWRKHPIDNQIVVKKGFPGAGVYAGFYGWVPFAPDGSDLPVSLEPALADRSASFAYGDYGAKLANYQRQLNLDDSRVVDYPTAIGLSAYYEKRYQDGTLDSQYRLTFAPRSSSRSR